MRMLRVVLLWLLALTGMAQSHALEPGYLEISAVSGDSYRVFWRKPTVQGAPMDIHARLPETCDRPTPPDSRFDGSAWSVGWVADCPGGLAGAEVAIDGLEATQTDVLVRFQPPEGSAFSARLTRDETAVTLPEDFGPLNILVTYAMLGTDHILEGIDHLLFVFALLVLIRDGWRLVGAITAFTVAHSITLGLASLGFLSVPGPPVEAIIALSIVFLAVEIAKRGDGKERLSERWPWLVSFSFGLLHGLGFAGALAEIGLPEGDILLALLGFNIGVEIGQLMFVAVVLAVGWVVLRVLPGLRDGQKGSLGARASLLAAYAIGTVASVWFIERVAGFAT